jgi:multiple sugar transport system permease protein
MDIYRKLAKKRKPSTKAILGIGVASNLLIYVVLAALAFPFVFPFLFMIACSLKDVNGIFEMNLIPEKIYWSNFIQVFTFQPFGLHYFNSTYIAVVVTASTLFVSSLSGYAFARIRFPGRSFFFLLFLSALMMPIQAAIIPNYFLMKMLGLLNTHVPLIIIPILGANGVLATFLMRQYFLSLPGELEDAAVLDGLNRFGIFSRIALPLAAPALGSVAILTFFANWNSFLEPLIYLNDLELYTIPLSLPNFITDYGLPVWNLQLAGTALSVVPILVVFFIAQKKIVNTMALSGLR